MKVLVYKKDPNPYQEFIYSRLRAKIEIKYLENPIRPATLGLFLLFLQLPYYRIKGYKIFHLHFFSSFSSPFENKLFNNFLTQTFFSFLFITFILFIKIFRYRLIWTVHNVIPLQKLFVNDVGVMKFLSNLTNSKIVHSKATLKKMKKLGINTDNSYIIPIGNYAITYPNIISKEQARIKLGITRNNFVFCFFGKIEIYKGVLELLHDFLFLKNKNIVLVIAGECRNLGLKRRILDYKNHSNIILHLEFVKDDIVQMYLNAADIAAYPFQTITTSSSVILALSFGKPIICPRIGNLEDLPENVGLFYEPYDKKGLLDCMKKAISNKIKIEEMSKNALKYTKNLSWDKIAEKTHKVFKDNI